MIRQPHRRAMATQTTMPGFSFLLLGVLHTAVAAAGSFCTSRFIVTITNQTNGVEIRIFPALGSNVELTNYLQREVNGHFLSRECGEAFQKCNQPLVTSVINPSGETFAVVFPLAKALGLLALSIANDKFFDELVVKDLSQYNCNPTSIYHIRNSHYVVCTNTETGLIQLLELKLNSTHIQQSTISDIEYLQFDSTHNVTDSLYVDLPSRSGSIILFASGYNILYFKPFDYLTGEFFVNLQEERCSATAIDYVGGWEMIVYCEDNRAMYVNIDSEMISTSFDYVKDGKPYACPNPDTVIAVNTEGEYIQYAFWSTKEVENFEIPMSAIDNGVCLGTENVTLFAFTDRQRGIWLLNATGGTVRPLSHTACTNFPCQPLLVLQDHYLVVREMIRGEWYITFFDSLDNFSPALEIEHTRADLIAIVTSQNMVNCTPQVGSSNASPSPMLGHQSNNHTSLPIIISVVPVVVVILVVLAFLGILFMYVKTRKCTALVATVQNIGFEQRHDIAGHTSLVAGIAIEETVSGGGFGHVLLKDEESFSNGLGSIANKDNGQEGSASQVTEDKQTVPQTVQ